MQMSFERLLKETEDRWRWRRLSDQPSERGRLKTKQDKLYAKVYSYLASYI